MQSTKKPQTIKDILDTLTSRQKEAFWHQIHAEEDLASLNNEQLGVFNHIRNIARSGRHWVDAYEVIEFDKPVEVSVKDAFLKNLSPEMRRYFIEEQLKSREAGKKARLEAMFSPEQQVILSRLLDEAYTNGIEYGL